MRHLHHYFQHNADARVSSQLKGLRAWLIYNASNSEFGERDAKMDFFANLRVSDLLAFLSYIMHSVVIVVFVVFCDYVAHLPMFGRDWFSLQLTTLDGYVGDGLNVTLSNLTLNNRSAMHTLRLRLNATAPAVSTYSSNGTLDTKISTSLLISEILLLHPTFSAADKALLTPRAAFLLEEWVRIPFRAP